MLVVLSPISFHYYICVGSGPAKCLKISKSIFVFSQMVFLFCLLQLFWKLFIIVICYLSRNYNCFAKQFLDVVRWGSEYRTHTDHWMVCYSDHHLNTEQFCLLFRCHLNSRLLSGIWIPNNFVHYSDAIWIPDCYQASEYRTLNCPLFKCLVFGSPLYNASGGKRKNYSWA